MKDSHHLAERAGEPSIVPGEPEPPSWLKGRALAYWRHWVVMLRNMQVLSPTWRDSLAQWCSALAEWEHMERKCQAAMQARQEVFVSERGSEAANPLFGLRDRAWDRVLKMGREFGYTPASKADIRVEETPQGTDKSRFFKG